MYVCYVFMSFFFFSSSSFFSFSLAWQSHKKQERTRREREREKNEEDLPRRTEQRNETKFEDRSVSIKAISLFLLTIIDITKYVLSAVCHVM